MQQENQCTAASKTTKGPSDQSDAENYLRTEEEEFRAMRAVTSVGRFG